MNYWMVVVLVEGTRPSPANDHQCSGSTPITYRSLI
jgi:hypothetical protein